MTANYSTREYREKLYDDLHVRLRDTAILMCAIFIASIGLNMNSTAVIIGAMLISPLMTPIVGLGFGLAIFDTRLIKQSLEAVSYTHLDVYKRQPRDPARQCGDPDHCRLRSL